MRPASGGATAVLYAASCRGVQGDGSAIDRILRGGMYGTNCFIAKKAALAQILAEPGCGYRWPDDRQRKEGLNW
jgi:hypothetical protein